MGVEYTSSVFYGVPLTDNWDDFCSGEDSDALRDSRGRVFVYCLDGWGGTGFYAVVTSTMKTADRAGKAYEFEIEDYEYRDEFVVLDMMGVPYDLDKAGWYLALGVG